MTDIQVKYWTNKESQRHNQAMERLTSQQNAEMRRHNVASENISALQAATSSRQVTVQEKLVPSNILVNEAKAYEANQRGDMYREQARGARIDSDVKEAGSWYLKAEQPIGFLGNIVKFAGTIAATMDAMFD